MVQFHKLRLFASWKPQFVKVIESSWKSPSSTCQAFHKLECSWCLHFFSMGDQKLEPCSWLIKLVCVCDVLGLPVSRQSLIQQIIVIEPLMCDMDCSKVFADANPRIPKAKPFDSDSSRELLFLFCFLEAEARKYWHHEARVTEFAYS